MKLTEERREFQRLDLDSPVPAKVNAVPVEICDLGVLGAGLEHHEPLDEGSAATLRFEWNGRPVEIECGVVRTVRGDDGVHHSGVRFFRAVGESDAVLRDMLAALVMEAIGHRKIPDQKRVATVDGDDTATAAPFVTYRFEEGKWRKRPAFLPEQPENGFTVATGEDEVELKRLCLNYEVADAEGRRLVRLFAELSISEHIGIPRRA